MFLVGGQFWNFAISRVIIGGGWALIGPAYSSLISKAVAEKLRGTAFGLFATSLGLISLPAPWIGARLWEAVNPIFPFCMPLVGILLMLPVMWAKFKLPTDGDGERGHSAEAVVDMTADTSPVKS